MEYPKYNLVGSPDDGIKIKGERLINIKGASTYTTKGVESRAFIQIRRCSKQGLNDKSFLLHPSFDWIIVDDVDGPCLVPLKREDKS